MNNPFDDLVTGVRLIEAITDPDEVAEVEEGLRQTFGRLEAQLNAIPDQPIQRAMAEPVEEAIAEPRGPRCYVTRRMAV